MIDSTAMPSSSAAYKAITSSQVFCMAPWAHLAIGFDGLIRTCCKSAGMIGDLSTSSPDQIWNSEELRALRRDMLAGRENPQCADCYALQKLGSPTIRQWLNGLLEGCFSRVAATRDDGHVAVPPSFLYLELSNTCNFRCRICGPIRSTAWHEDSKALYGAELTRRARAVPQIDILRAIRPWLSNVERIHFSGGEPLQAREHFQLMDELVARRMFHVGLIYSTNFSFATHEGRDIMRLWDRFENVQVLASLDGSRERGEYIRKGQDWAQVIDNRQKMLKTCPRVRFQLAPTLSIMNALHLPDFHWEWIQEGYVSTADFGIDILKNPSMLSIQVLPRRLKRQVKEKYLAHIERVRAVSAEPGWAWPVENHYAAAINFLEAQELSKRLRDFKKWTVMVDLLRNERFETTFPELAELMV